MPEKTDEEIALNVQQGDIPSFGLLIERYKQKLTRYAHKFLFNYDDTEDLIQEVFIKAYINIQDFDPKRRFSPWIYRIAHNEFINKIKKKNKETISLFNLDTLFPHPIAQETADGDIRTQDIREMINSCLQQLKPKYRELLILYYFEEMDYKEIAEILKIPISTVGIRLRRGKELLKKLLTKDKRI